VYADRAYYWLGEANYAEHRFAAAIHHFSVVIEQFPDSEKAPDARLRRAYALIDSHQFQRARQELEVVRVLYGGRSVATLASLRINQLDHAGR